MGRARRAGPLVVQQSFPDPRPTTNPYIVMLADALRADAGIELRTFSWRSALLGRYDVFHAHWPEILVTGRSRTRSAVRQALFAALLLRLRARRIPVVRTRHNLELPSGLTGFQAPLLRRFERAVTAHIALNEQTPASARVPQTVILHGHYRTWFAAYPRPAAVPGRFAYFGLIRRYKNVEALIHAFRGLQGDVTLTVAGRPSGAELATGLQRAAADDPRIRLALEFQEDAAIATIVGEAVLVVLPYLHMHNSGGVLAALSLGRPVLVPRNAANETLAAEVGDGWVLMYDGHLSAVDLERALERAAELEADAEPDLSGRDWGRVGEAHRRVYTEAVARRGQLRRYSR